MTRTVLIATFTLLFAATAARGDGLIFSYEGDILPGDPGSGFDIFDSCAPDCSRRLEAGHFLLEWGTQGNLVNYNHFIAQPPDPPPETLWVEWQFRSNQAMPPTSTTCDGKLTVDYKGILDIAWMFQDAVVDNEGGDFVLGLDPDIFHTYRFESLDGANYTMSVDGEIFNVFFDPDGNDFHLVQFGGFGACTPTPVRPVPVRNEWDYIRYGTIESGEQIIASDPPAGIITDEQATGLTIVLVTFDRPNYLYVNDITVTVSSGIAPNVIATRRLDNGSPYTVVIVLDGELPRNATTTFTFTDASGVQTISYTRIPPDIPATSTWGIIVLAIGCLTAGGLILRRRTHA